jgi:hypothetical protein
LAWHVATQAASIRIRSECCGRTPVATGTRFALGAAFAAEAHIRASESTPEHTDRAARLLCGLSAPVAAALVRETARDLHGIGDTPAYEVWRSRVRERLSGYLAESAS